MICLPITLIMAFAAKLTNAEMTVGCMLLRHLQLTQYNAHEIYESVVKKKTKDEWSLGDAKMNYVGLALYPSSDYYNHGCHPTLARLAESEDNIIIHHEANNRRAGKMFFLND